MPADAIRCVGSCKAVPGATHIHICIVQEVMKSEEHGQKCVSRVVLGYEQGCRDHAGV